MSEATSKLNELQARSAEDEFPPVRREDDNEFQKLQSEKDELFKQLEAAEKRAQEAEKRAQEAEVMIAWEQARRLREEGARVSLEAQLRRLRQL